MNGFSPAASRAWTIALLLLAACVALARSTPEPGTTAVAVSVGGDPVASPFLVASQDTSRRFGLHLRLLDVPAADAPAETSTAAARPLAQADVDALLRGFAPIAPPLESPFRFASGSLPAPRPGTVTRGAFAGAGAAAGPPAVASPGPLRAMFTSPRGVVTNTSQISVTFSRAMVPLSKPPAPPASLRLTPTVPGAWRWLDTHTLVFEGTGELPRATRYSVEIPAGLRAADGTPLRESVRWSFTTTPPAVRDVAAVDAAAGSGPFIVIVLDQRVDAAAVLPFLRLDLEGTAVPIALASPNARELAQLRWRLSQSPESTTVVIRARDRIPAGTGAENWKATLRVLPGLPSLEGPELTNTEAAHAFEIRKGLRVVQSGCGRAQLCVPGVPWTIQFSYPLRPAPDTAGWARVEPALPGATIEVWNNHLVVLGAPVPGITYRVWLDSTIAMWSGDQLGRVPPIEFTVGDAPPGVWLPGGGLAVIAQEGRALYPILAEGVDSVRVRVRAVAAEDWPRYATTVAASRNRAPNLLPGRDVIDASIAVTPMHTGPGQALVDLENGFDGSEHLLVIVDPVVARSGASGETTSLPAVTWVQRSDDIVDVSEDGEAVTVRVTSARTGRPIPGVALTLNATHRGSTPPLTAVAHGTTDSEGLAILRADVQNRGPSWVIAAIRGGRTTLLPRWLPGRQRCCDPYEWRPAVRAHFLTDRPLYSPGDTVRFAGWLRRVSGVGREPAAPGSGWSARFQANGPRGESLATGDIEIATSGRIEGEFALPAEVNAGYAHVQLQVRSRDGEETHFTSLHFEVQEVRRPNFEVAVAMDPGPHRVGARLTANAKAKYFTGGGLPGAQVRWMVHSALTSFTPPNAPDYTFGRLRNWGVRNVEPALREARTDASGGHRIEIVIDSVHPGAPALLEVRASVEDVDRQQRTATTRVIVHPADVYVGLRTASRFVRSGETLLVDALVVDIEGRVAPDRPITLRALRQDHGFEPRRGRQVQESVRASCALRSLTTSVRCTFPDLPPGDYVIAATVEDTVGRRSESEILVRVAGVTIPASARLLRDSLALHTDRDSYAPGDTAKILIETSLQTAEALLTVRRAGVLDARPVRLVGGNASVQLPIVDAHAPNVHVHVAAVGADGATASGSVELQVAPRLRTLNVTVTPRSAEVAPGDTTRILVSVLDANGQAVRDADIVLSGVDEALLALSRFPRNDPIEDMYGRSGPAILETSLRARRAPIIQDVPEGKDAAVITGMVIDGSTGDPVPNAWVEHGERGAWSGADGRYRLEGLASGPRVIQALARGYVTGIAEIDVPGTGTARANFLLLTRNAVLANNGRRPNFPALGISATAVSLDELVVAGGVGGGGRGGELEQSAFSRFDVAAPISAAMQARERTAEDDVLLRRNFSPVAAFVADARTGPDGRVEIAVNVPHSLTRYRLRVVAAAGDRLFGVGEAALTARQVLMVRPSPPRFLHQGDRFELPVIIENRASAPIDVDVAVRATNAVAEGVAGQRVRVPGNDRVEVRFPFAAGRAGEARFQIAAAPTSGVDAERAPASQPSRDATEIALPVLLPAVTENFAVYGELNDARPVGYPLQLPEATLPGQSRVEVGFSTTAAHGLSDALWFLLDCPFDLPEIWASRIIALSALLDAPAASPWPKHVIEASIHRDVTRLARFQLRDGGWSPWTPIFDADPFLTVHAVHALQRARDAGVKVPERTLADAVGWLERIDEHAPPDTAAARRPRIPTQPGFAEDFPLQAKRAVQAYALDVRRLLGHDVSASAASLLDQVGAENLPAEALAWLLPSLAGRAEHAQHAEDVRRVLSSRLLRSAGTAAFVSPYDAGARHVFYSPRRSDAVVLNALLEDKAMRDLLAPIAHGLFAHRVRGRWSNSQENAFAVLALSRYTARAEAVEPALVARAWAGPRLAGERSFDGRSDDRHEILIPADSIGGPGANMSLVVAREGAGRLYYRVGVRYTTSARVAPIARGFEVARTYEAVDQPEDVRRAEDATWHVRLGARVRVRITIGAAGPRYHVALTDPLPAGFEAINPFLAGTEGLRRQPTQPARVSGLEPLHPEHVNVRADRFEAFSTLLQPGRREITYYAIATTPGDFAAPAPRAEEMYSPETFGRGAGERVIVGSGLPF